MSSMSSDADLESRAARLAERLRAEGRTVTLGLAVGDDVAAEYLGVSPRTLRSWRKESRGPRSYVAGRVFYPLVELLRYVDGQCQWQDAADDGR